MNRIAFSGNRFELITNSFVFTIKSEQFYEQCSSDNVVLNTINKERILNCYCMKINDFCKHGDSNYSLWEVKKVFCFVTVFPLLDLFIELLLSLINKIKEVKVD